MVKAGQQKALCHVEHLFAGNFHGFNGAGKQHTQIQHHLEQQIFRGSVRFYVIHQREHILLADFFRRVVHRLHVAFVQTQAAEADVQISRSRQTGILFNFPARTADTLLADFADVLVACLVGFALLVRLFRQLHHDKLAVFTIFSVQFHHSMGSRCGTREEVENDSIFFNSRNGNQIANQF